jgi:hypothetical protein
MNKTKAIYKTLIVIILLFENYSFAYAKINSARKNTINLSYSNITIQDDNFYFNDDLPNLQLLFNHKITNFLSVGGNVGFGLYEEFFTEKTDNRNSLIYKDYTNSILYGLNSRLHILPLFIKSENLRFDLYLSGEVGVISLNSSNEENIIPIRGNYFDYSFMAGGTVYLSNNFGLFAEAGYKRFKYHNGFNAKYGFAVRF